jgi:GH35 family endo-1,4-beta-xylanase
MEELNFGSQEWSGYNRLSQCYLEQLKKFKANNIPVDYAGLEMNSWIYDPPSEKIMINFMEQVKGLGYQFSSAEANAVTSSDKYPTDPGRPKTITKIDDPLAAQAQVYHDVLEAYLTVGSRAFGISGVDDGNEWFASVGDPEAHSMIYDANFAPKPAYFVIQDLLTNFVAITPTPTP